MKSPEIAPKVCHCPTYSEEQNRVWGVTKSPAPLPQTLLSGGLARMGGGSGKKGNWLDFDLEILPARDGDRSYNL